MIKNICRCTIALY